MEQPLQKRNDLRAQLDRLGFGAGKPEKARVIPVSDLRRAVRKTPQARTPRIAHNTALPQPAAVSIHYGRTLPRLSPPRAAATSPSANVILEEALNGVESHHANRGPFYLLTTEVATVENGSALNECFPSILEDHESGLSRLILNGTGVSRKWDEAGGKGSGSF